MSARLVSPAPVTELIVDVSGIARGNPGLAGVGIIIRDRNGRVLDRIGRYLGVSSPSQAHYQAVLIGLQAIRPRQPARVVLRVADEAVFRQLQGKSPVRTPDVIPLFSEVQEIISTLPRVEVLLAPADETSLAEAVANVVVDSRGRRTAID